FIGMVMREGHLTSPTGAGAGGFQRNAILAAAGLDQFDEQVGERQALLPQRLHVDLVPDVERALQRPNRQDWLGATLEAAYAFSRRKSGFHGKGAGMAPPARKRLHDVVVMPAGRIDEGRGAGAAIEIFVG